MTVPTTAAKWGPYVGNGVTTVFPYSGKIASASELLVIKIALDTLAATLLTITTDYTIPAAGINNDNGGTVVLNVAPSAAFEIVIKRIADIRQMTDLKNQGAFFPEIHEDVFDRLTKVDQQIQAEINDIPIFPRQQLGQYLVWGSANNTFVNAVGAPSALVPFVDLTKFGAIEGAADNYTALQAAADSGLPVYIPPGTWKTSQPISFIHDNCGFYGNKKASKLYSTDNDSAVLTVLGGTTGVRIYDLYIGRTVPAIGGGNGINVIDNLSNCELSGLFIENQYNGVSLGPTDFSTFTNSIIQKCYNNGVLILNTAVAGACQWSMQNIGSFNNSLHGFFIASITGPAGGMTLGTFQQLSTFANSGFGIGVAGIPGMPIHGFRLLGGFIGGDGDNEISIDSYGDQHTIRSVFVEGAGIGLTGRLYTTPASNIGNGIAIGSTNIGVSVVGCHSSSNAMNGFTSQATRTLFNGNVARNNGISLVANQRNGIYILGGSATCIGNHCNNYTTTTQEDGIRSAVDGVVIIGNDLTGNATLGFHQTVGIVNTVLAFNKGNLVTNAIWPGMGGGTGIMSVGAVDSGGAGFKLLRVPN